MAWAQATTGWEYRSDEPSHPRAWIQVSPDRTRHVLTENHGEHHMGAESVVIVPDRPVAGVTRFHTTNGQARFDPNSRWLIIEGVIGFVAVRLDDGAVAHYQDPAGAFIGSWSVSAETLEWRQGRTEADRRDVRSIPLDEIRGRWQPGLGPFADGEFQPHRPFVDRWDEWSASGGRDEALGALPSVDAEAEGAFTVKGNRSSGLLAFTVVITTAVVAGLVIGALSGEGAWTDTGNLFLIILAMIGLAPGLVVAESLVRHPRWIHFGSDSIVIRQMIGERHVPVRKITDIKSLHFTGSSFRFPLHVMVIFLRDDKPVRIDSDMVERNSVRDVVTLQRIERRVRRLYQRPGAWIATDRRYPELSELIKQTR